MNEIRKSPLRGTFQKEKYLERQAEKGLTPENDADTLAMLEYYDSWNVREDENEKNLEWRKNNLEYDLRTSDYIAQKCNEDYYAQNLYAALCNNEFTRNDVWPILSDQRWSCSWRYAGGIIAHIQQKGDYIDWYCSGIRDTFHNDDPIHDLTPEQLARLEITKKYVSESIVTDEIRNDLFKLGWIVVPDDATD